MISGQNVTYSYRNRQNVQSILNGISFEVEPSNITAFIGKSGSGKTTLLKCIAGLHGDYEGTITCNGRELRLLCPMERATTMGFVLQQFHLFSHLTVLQNCTHALRVVLGLKEKADGLAIEMLASLGMHPWLHAYPNELSGGQQQRVAIARALVMQPHILLLDEPTSALDPDSKKQLETVLLDLRDRGLTLILSSHDMPFIEKMVDRVYYLHEGTLAEQYDRTKDRPVFTAWPSATL